MKFASIGHLIDNKTLGFMPNDWIKQNYIISPEINLGKTSGRIIALKLTAEQMMSTPRDQIRNEILKAVLFAQNEFDIDLIQLGALTTSVTSGGKWILEQNEYNGYLNHGDSYTASVVCQTVSKMLENKNIEPKDKTLAIIGAYGIIGEALSKLLVPKFSHSLLVGRREEKLIELSNKINGCFDTTIDLNTKDVDIIITATNHPTALLNSNHLKNNAIVIDVAQPPNLNFDVCKKRNDVLRIDGGFVDFPFKFNIPGLPPGKILSCIAEIIMQAMENEKQNHIGSIDLNYLKKTEDWGKKYGFVLNDLTNFGNPVHL